MMPSSSAPGRAGRHLQSITLAPGERWRSSSAGHLGGSCVNVGCMPTKAWVASAHAAYRARAAMGYGVRIRGDVSMDMALVKARKDAIVSTARKSVEDGIASLPNCRLIRGHGRFLGPNLVAVNGEQIAAQDIFVNVGGRAAIPTLPGLDEIAYLTSSSILELDTLPAHLLIIGGSYIGLEFAQMFRRFGGEVTLVERSPRLLPHRGRRCFGSGSRDHA